MPAFDGIEATRRILAGVAGREVVVLTSFSDRDRVLGARRRRRGYLLKDAEPDELLRGIRSAARGESPSTRRAAPRRSRAPRLGGPRPTLTAASARSSHSSRAGCPTS